MEPWVPALGKQLSKPREVPPSKAPLVQYAVLFYLSWEKASFLVFHRALLLTRPLPVRSFAVPLSAEWAKWPEISLLDPFQ